MKNYLSRLNSYQWRIIRSISGESGLMGMPVYIVGGVVRDILLGKPITDLDLTLEGDAIGVAKRFARKWKAELIVYKQFGTATAVLPNQTRIDFATTRKECYPHPGALPVIKPGTLQEDLFRRDFTINAMAIAVHPGRFGQLVDYYGGQKDLARRVIRVLHEQSFWDDPTRILRAVRFEQRFKFRLERHTLFQIKRAIQQNAVAHVKPQRYFTEFKKILSESDPVPALKRLGIIKGLDFITGQMRLPAGRLSKLSGEIKRLRNKKLFAFYKKWWIIYLLGLFEDLDRPVLASVIKKLQFTKDEQKTLRGCADMPELIGYITRARLSASDVYRTLYPLTMDQVVFLRVRIARRNVCRRIDQYLKSDRWITLKINGEDLKQAGIASGQKIGTILNGVLYAKIDGKLSNRKDELKEAMRFSR